jgi:hypothetical protein
MIGPEPQRKAGSTSRIAKELLAYLRPQEGYLGVVEWEKEGDVCVIDRQGAPIYFQEPGSLKTPFSIALDSSAMSRNGTLTLKVGDRLYKRDSCILRLPDRAYVVDLSCSTLVDLNRALQPVPIAEDRSCYLELLAHEVYRAGSFEGLAGLLFLLPGISSNADVQESNRPISVCSRYAADAALLVVEGARTRNDHLFRTGFDKLVGLGPGFTPSGDDLLLGFLATHRVWSSPFWQMIVDSPLSVFLHAAACRTTVLSSALLRSALQGNFAETIYCVFQLLAFEPDKIRGATDELLHTGHTSGSDLLTGMVLGLMTA